jgi:2-oxoisovalerate dehydrogenase E2 component (dihydrolipoyl transacylase)
VETQREPIEASTESAQEIKIIGLRRIIAEKMVLSKRNIPHFTFVEEIDVTELEALRVNLNEQRGPDKPKLTPLPFLMRGVVKLVPAFPSVNARYDEDTRLLRCYKAVHIGIATQTEAGLMVPVVRNAQDLDLWESARQIQRLSEAARAGRAIRDELVGSTITLTSLGALGGVSATPIINHPEVAIIGPNKMVERPVVRHGAVVVRTMMNLSASFDHRIIDGYEAARFVQELKRLIEQPALLFLDAS